MFAEPALRPLTTPLAATVAIATSDEDHVPPACAFARVVVAPSHTVAVPAIAVSTGVALMFIVKLTALEQPFALVTV